LLGPPTVVVASGGEWQDPEAGEVEQKLHLHWRLAAPTRTDVEHGRLREARTVAAQIVGADASAKPIVHPLRWPGSWHTKGAPRMARIVEANPDAEIVLDAALAKLSEAAAATTKEIADDRAPQDPAGASQRTASLAEIASWLDAIPNRELPWDEWNRVGMAAWGASEGKAFEAFDRWSAKAVKYNAEATAARWQHYATSPPDKIGAGTLAHLAADDGRPVVRVRAGALSATATRGEEVLRDAGVPLFQRSGTLVRPVIADAEAAHGRRTKIAQFVRVDAVYLRDLLGRVARWERYDGRSKRCLPSDPPSETAPTILARVGEWGFPVVTGVITTPTMRPDGSLLTEPGYDPVTRLLLVEPPHMPPIPNAPTRADAEAALCLLERLLDEFPLVDDIARAVALSALITPVVRGAFPVAPMHAARAPVAGSGKSFLYDVVAAIAIGQPMPVMAAGANEEETEKRLGAALMTAQPLISIDNVNGELRGDALCQMIERPVVEVRILGKSERVRIEARATSIFCTGNNMVLVGDLCRRTITATLDPRVERPELREFAGNPVATVLADRGAYVAAALTVCRAYIAAGRPNRAGRLASFEGWSDTVRSALIWLGRADPVASMEAARAEDPEFRGLKDLLAAWAAAIGVGSPYRLKLQEVIERASETDGLREAVQATARAGREADATSLGNWARRRKGRIVDGLHLTNNAGDKGGAEWWVENTDGTDVPPTAPAVAGVVLQMWMVRETGAAVLLATEAGPEVWLPKSQIAMVMVDRESGLFEVTVPSWLAKEKGLQPGGGAEPDAGDSQVPF